MMRALESKPEEEKKMIAPFFPWSPSFDLQKENRERKKERKKRKERKKGKKERQIDR